MKLMLQLNIIFFQLYNKKLVLQNDIKINQIDTEG